MLEASVIICTHNPRPHYLRRVVESLRNQTLPMNQWELLIIDNASKEPLASSKSWDLSWHPHGRHIREDELGLTAARLCGIREAASDMLVYVDDDNVLEANYLSEAIRIKQEWPILGVWGSGSTVPEFELQPAKQVLEFTDMLALRNVSAPQWSNIIPCAGARPWGAGQCVRSGVAAAYRDYCKKSSIKVSDRSGGALSGGGDVEISYVSCTLGLGVGIFPNLKLTHLIPKERVSEDYLVKLAEGLAGSAALLEYKWENVFPELSFVEPFGPSASAEKSLDT